MGRKVRQKWVSQPPNNLYFSDIESNNKNTIILTISEFEAMRLRHYVNLNQKNAADKMGVSQPTFSRILEKAHQKTTQALFEGKEIKIYGGNIDLKRSFNGYGCLECDYEWEDKMASKDRNVECVQCSSRKTYYLMRDIS